jgi:hypothetical protein
MKIAVKMLICAAVVVFCGTLAQATQVLTNAGYLENFNEMGTTGGTCPDGYSLGAVPGGNTTFGVSGATTNAGPITAAGAASASGWTTSVVEWDMTQGQVKSSTNAYNCGVNPASADRALGEDPTGDAANALQLILMNGTGAPLSSVTFAYDEKCFSLGTCQYGATEPDEGNDLPGYAFFYSTTGSTLASDWSADANLHTTSYTVGGVEHATDTITFASPVAPGGSMYFRWLDDNGYWVSPDQMFAIDNVTVAVAPTPEPATLTVLVLGGLAILRRKHAA